MSECSICKRTLDVEGDRRTADCGGDCAQCMAEADDPSYVHLLNNGRADEEVWTTHDGRKIAVGEMDEAHVRDTLRMVIRRARKGEAKRLAKRALEYRLKLAATGVATLHEQFEDDDRKWGRS